MAPEIFDAIVIGAGQAGGPLSTALAKAGYKTVIIEREHVGGTCINEGCTPTKTMVASARAAYLARRGADYGVHTGSVSVDMVKVRQRKRDIVDSFRGGSERRLLNVAGLDLIRGEASFTALKTVEIHLHGGGTRSLTAERIFINAGARPAQPAGFEAIPTLNSTSIMELDTLPDHLIAVGGGYIGLEFGQMFRRFGSRVTIIQRGPRLLDREDADIADEVAKIMREDGIEVLLQTTTTRAERTADGQIHLTVKGPDGERSVIGSHVLVAAGRTPNSDRLNLGATGIQPDNRGFIPVNDRLETPVAGIYALGDIKGGPAFTHISYDDFRIIRTNLIENGNARTRDRLVPYVVFIDPQLGRVGLGEEEARTRGLNIQVARMPMNNVARAVEVDETRGFMKAIVDAETGQILGGAVLGIEGGEIMAMLEMAMLGHLPYTVLRDAVFAHPTLSESLNNLFSSLE
ncbi:MAG TPA: mercuric reductase [Aggregatilineales bacterium]|nr:mercuric reductase [Aggregatilineales bacterium]